MFSSLRLVIWNLALCTLLASCTPVEPFRKNLYSPGALACPIGKVETIADCAKATPEVDPGNYELHFVEFDDQGWLYPEPRGALARPGGAAWNQADHVIKRLSNLLDQDAYLNLIVYVHGWKHNAAVGDPDLQKFRELLKGTALLETMSNPPGAGRQARRVVGIYVGWRGKSWDLPDWPLNLSFWSRKSAAQHVALGAVQDLFARLRAVQARYNTSAKGESCLLVVDRHDDASRCKIRSLIIGHSFGAAIVYAAVAPQLIESLSVAYDRLDQPNPAAKALDGVEPLADMVVLLNPAFEASRFEPLRRAADRYRPPLRRPPLMVLITTENDVPTRYFFPLGRFLNTLSERPVTNTEQGEAIRTTPGHMADYITHSLTLGPNPCPRWVAAAQADSRSVLDSGETMETENAKRFYVPDSKADNGTMRTTWRRAFCGGAVLETVQIKTGNVLQTEVARPVRNPNPLIWNVRTTKEMIDGHGGITLPAFIDFVRQLYDDVKLPQAYGGLDAAQSGARGQDTARTAGSEVPARANAASQRAR